MDSQKIFIIIALIIYFAICIGLGLYSMAQSKKASARDFLTAGGNVPWLVNAVCVFAAFNSGGALMGNFGTAYSAGWGYMCTMCGGTATGMLIASLLVAGPLRNLRVATVPEFFRQRFHNKLLNILVPVILICCITGYLMAQMKVAGMLGEKIFGLPYSYGVILIAIVYIFYTAVGGMFSVTLTDCFQGFVMLFVLTLAMIFCVGHFDGLGNLYSTAVSLRPQWAANTTATYPRFSFLGGFMGWMFVNTCLPHSIMRVFTAKNAKSGKIGLGMGALLIGFFAINANIIIPAAGVILNNGADLGSESDYVFMQVIDNVFPVWFEAITYAGVFAAVMSSVSGMLLSIGSACSYDLVQVLKPDLSSDKIKKLSSLAIVVFGILSAILSLDPPDLLTILYASAMGILASGLAAPVILGLWWKRTTRYGALASVIVGPVLWIGTYLSGSFPPLSSSAIAIPVSFIVCIVVSLITPAPANEELEKIALAHSRELTDAEL